MVLWNMPQTCYMLHVLVEILCKDDAVVMLELMSIS